MNSCSARRALAAAQRDQSGAAAIEFAVILPLMLLLYLGLSIIVDGLMTSFKVANMTVAVLDSASRFPVTTQASSIPSPPNAVTQAELEALAISAQTFLFPKAATSLQLTISAVDIKSSPSFSCCTATVRWSFTHNGALRPCGVPLTSAGSGGESPLTLPSELLPQTGVLPAPIAVLIVDASYAYQPLIDARPFPSTFMFNQTQYKYPRSSGQLAVASLAPDGSFNGRVCY